MHIDRKEHIKEFVNDFFYNIMYGKNIADMLTEDTEVICSCENEAAVGEKAINRLLELREEAYNLYGKCTEQQLKITNIKKVYFNETEEVYVVSGILSFETGRYFYSAVIVAGERIMLNQISIIATPVTKAVQENMDNKKDCILIAEDNEINSDMLKYMLEKSGRIVHVAENGREAVEMFKKSAPGVYKAVIMDLFMPELSGFDAAAEIRSLDREDAKQIRIYAMTANIFEEDMKHALESGMDGCVAKPVDMKKIHQIIG